MSDNKDFKINLRGIYSGDGLYIVEWRFSPDQDLWDYKVINVFGLFKIRIPFKHSTKWKRPLIFSSSLTGYMYDFEDDFNYNYLWCNGKEGLNRLKWDCPTYDKFISYIRHIENKAIEEWRVDREEYLAKKKDIIY